ncbi:MAG: 2OG-Fe(II) oxygenase [Pseudomonadota bacterium]
MQSVGSFISIRDKQLDLNNLVDARLYNEIYLLDLRQRIKTAQPFQHIVEDGWFNPQLLELVLEEFDLSDPTALWRSVSDKNQSTRRSLVNATLGPASQIYFNLVNSGWFVQVLSFLTGVDDLLVDAHLYGGGLHETKAGGRFGIHRDFDRHVRSGLHNEMVMITYLNKSWQSEWNGALELWDATKTRCVTSIAPEFGRTILMRHGPNSFHGHPQPLTPPEGVTRRSLASYYYSNHFAKIDREGRHNSLFLFMSNSDRARHVSKAIMPPMLWEVISKIIRSIK